MDSQGLQHGGVRGRVAQRVVAGMLALWSIGAVAGMVRRDRPLDCVNLRPWSECDSRYARMGQRYLPLAEPLRGQKTVGFVSSFHHDEGHRMMAQSVLAPTLVIDSDEPAVLVAAFRDDRELERFIAASPFVVRRRFSDGVAIVERQ